MKILIIIPAYNEAESIEKVIENLEKQVPFADYLIIDDCSNDDTKKICRENHLNYLSFPINLGIGGGVQAGYQYALENGYDVAIQHDGDGQHDPKYIKDVIQPLIDNTCDIVIGSRFISKEGFQSSATRRLGINFLSWLIFICTGIRIKDVTSGFRAVNREYIKLYATDYPQDYPEPEAIVIARLNGARIKEVPVIMKERENGVSSISFRKSIYYMLKVSMAILICRFTNRRKRK